MARDETFARPEEIGEALFSILKMFSWYKKNAKVFSNAQWVNQDLGVTGH